MVGERQAPQDGSMARARNLEIRAFYRRVGRVVVRGVYSKELENKSFG